MGEKHFCGESAETGEPTPGCCGPNCAHCGPDPVLAVQDGVWLCAADYEWEEQ